MNEWLIFIHMVAGLCLGVALSLDLLLTDYEDGECVKSLIKLTVITIFITGSLILGIYKVNTGSWDLPDNPYRTVKIVALNDNNMANGRFYLRRGYISEDLYYQYMKKEGLGFKAGKVKADKTTLYYAEDKNYRLECYEKTRKWLWFENSEYYYKIYIPEGSITEDYIVDLE